MAKPTAQNLRYPLQELRPVAVAGDSSPIFWQWTYTNEHDTTRTMLISLHPGGQFCGWEISGTLNDAERYAIMQKIQQETESSPAALTSNQPNVRLSYRAGINFMLMPKQEMWQILEEYFSDDHALFCEIGKIGPAGRRQLYRDLDRNIGC
ncbi:MAG: hypothetical protein EYC62_04080 [Alphaproteobacteria bacterium]|nr:MAG: hypothetical protein EYC62_04080 [Alphaproteobacteria bacterium]